MNPCRPHQPERAPSSAAAIDDLYNPLLATNKELRRHALARLQDLANAGYSPGIDVALPDTPAVIQQAAAALLAQVLERTEAPQDLVYQLATVITGLARLSDAGAGPADERDP